MMATSLEKELRLIRLRLDPIEDALAEEMSESDKKARLEALKEHKEGKTVPFFRKATVEGMSVDQSAESSRQRS